MSMIVKNNMAAQRSLNELNKNNAQLGKALAKVSSGMKINSAGDDASQFSISEFMRVRIRALDQANQNVQNGNSLLATAEAGIQQQIDLVRTIKEKVINAANDTNTDEDRLIIQKEIDQFYEQIDQTAYETDYNTQKPLLGNKYWRTISNWMKFSEPIHNPDSNMYLIEDYYSDDGVVGDSFDTFQRKYGEYKSATSTTFPASNPINVNNLTDAANQLEFSGGDDTGTAAVLEVDFSSIDINQLRNVQGGTGLTVTGVHKDTGNSTSWQFVLTKETTSDTERFSSSPSSIDGPSKKTDYSLNNNTVNISSGSVTDMLNKIATTLRSQTNYFSNVQVNGTKLTLTSANKTTRSENMRVSSFSASERYVKEGAASTFSGSVTIAGNLQDENGNIQRPYNTGSITIPANTTGGVLINGTIYELTNGSNGHSGTRQINTSSPYTRTYTNYYTYSQTYTITGTKYYYTSNSSDYDVHYKKISSLSGFTSSFTTRGADPNDAHLDINLSGYTDVEDLISDFEGKSISYYRTGSGSYSYTEFYDSKSETITQARNTSSTYSVDLNNVRQAVKNGQTIAQAFATQFRLSGTSVAYLDGNDDDITSNTSLANTIETLRIKSGNKGSAGNNDKIYVYQAELSHYDIDFNQWFNNNPDADIPKDLDGKGFRWYCSTDDTEWFNIIFRTDTSDKPPESGSGENVIKSINIDVSHVTDAKSLVDAIYQQANEKLTGSNPKYNHYYRLAKTSEETSSGRTIKDGWLTVYDNRTFNVSSLTNLYQVSDNGARGAKISDGVLDDVIKVNKDLRIRRLIIQDTDKADMNLQVQIPDMRLDSIFNDLEYGKKSIREYSLAIKEERDALLGLGGETGILDAGLEYLLDAAVMVGVQRARLESDQNNLVTQTENETASESTIRDADMAKEMTEYTKMNILSQSAQAMLAQANQNSSAVLSLLQ